MRIIHLVIVLLLIVLVYLFFRPRILEEYGRGGRHGRGHGRGGGRRSWYGGGVGYYDNPWYYPYFSYPSYSYPSYSYSYPYYY